MLLVICPQDRCCGQTRMGKGLRRYDASPCYSWCPERGSNSHGLGPRDFKSLVSTSFTIRAQPAKCVDFSVLGILKNSKSALILAGKVVQNRQVTKTVIQLVGYFARFLFFRFRLSVCRFLLTSSPPESVGFLPCSGARFPLGGSYFNKTAQRNKVWFLPQDSRRGKLGSLQRKPSPYCPKPHALPQANITLSCLLDGENRRRQGKRQAGSHFPSPSEGNIIHSTFCLESTY